MKNMRKLFAMVLAVMMVMTLATSVFATDITINDGTVTDAKYAAYKLLNATNDGSAKYAYTLNDTYTDILKEVTGKTTEEDIVAYIAALDATGIRTFADAVYAKIVAASITADRTTENNVFTGVDQGYYLIAETQIGTNGDLPDTVSLVMLDTAGKENITVDTKEEPPTVVKKVEEKNDTTGASSWGDSADYDIGDVINYEITGEVSNKYANYKNYFYSFVDTMDAGLTYNKDAKVYVVNGSTETEVTYQFDIDETDHSFTAKKNLKKLTLPEGVTINADTKVVVRYSATLNDNAVSGKDGNKNEVILKFENNPYNEDEGEPKNPGETPKDVNIVFTFDGIVNKVDKDGAALAGAGFTLYKQIPDTSADEDTDPDWVVVKEITDNTTFEFKGLDAGIYKLVETTVPAGYNKADDVIFEVVPVYDTTKDPDKLTELQVKIDGVVSSGYENAPFNTNVTEGSVTTDVVNRAGTELPSTGGMGTTLFYLFGGVMVMAAVVLLVTKKRMAA